MGSVGCVARGGVATTSQCVTRRTRGGDGARARSRATARTQNAPRFGGVTTRRHENGLRVTVTGNDRDRKWHRVHASADELSGLDKDGITDTTKLDRLTERDTPNTFVTKTDEVSAIAIVSDAEVSRTKTIDPEIVNTSEETHLGWSLDPFPGSFQELAQKWQTLPSRYRVILGTTAAFVLCNMDKVNISVAIIPMAKEMGWSVGQAGLLQSAFFYGFALSQLPGGYLATRFGGARMLPIGVFLWSAATCAVPFCANDPTLLFASRVLVGLGEGVSPAAAVDVIARSVPAQERSRAVAFVFNGFNIGSVLGLSLAPAIIENFGWRSVFVTFGGLGVFWVAWVGLGVYQRGGAMPGATRDNAPKELAPVRGLTGRRPKEVGGTENENTDELSDEKDEENKPVPWGEILSCTPVRALAYVHFCNNWGFYVLLAWLPSYFTQELGVTLTNASLFTLCPPLANIAVASFVGPLAGTCWGFPKLKSRPSCFCRPVRDVHGRH